MAHTDRRRRDPFAVRTGTTWVDPGSGLRDGRPGCRRRPGGAALALTLLRYSARSVIVVERSSYSEWRIGETLPPGVAGLLAWLGAAEVLAAQRHLPSAGTAAGACQHV
jgi:hypothetical protein